MNRRGFLKLTAGGIAAAIAAPYVITTPGLLMKVRPIISEGEAFIEAMNASMMAHCADIERAMMYGEPMTATEVLARQAEAEEKLRKALFNLGTFGYAIMPPDIEWFRLKNDKANSA